MMYYFMLIFAAALFASQFLFNQKFNEECGSTWHASLIFTLYTSVVSFVAMLLINGFRLQFSIFSFVMVLIYAAVNILYSYMSIKAFSVVNLSVYSVFAMLGGMILPFLYGIVFCNESITFGKIICCILITVSLLITVSSGKKKGKLYYLSVFILNGLVGVLSTIHQGNINAVGSVDFMALNRIVTVVICIVIWLASGRNTLKISRRAFGDSALYAIFCGFGNLLTLISLKHLQASVQYPIITGGVIVLSLLISIIRKEQITRRDIISALFAFIATILIMF